MGRYSILEHTADKGLDVFAATLSDMFETAAEGLFALMVEPDTQAFAEPMEIEVKAIDLEMLLVRWLNELLYHFEVHKRLFSGFKVELTEGEEMQKLHATVFYRTVDPQTIEWTGAPVKSVTYHGLILEPRDGGWFLRYYVDV